MEICLIIANYCDNMEYLNKINRNNCVGGIFKSNNCGDFEIIRYNNSHNIEIEFLTTGSRKTCEISSLRRGNIKDVYQPSVCGVGVVGNKYVVSEVNDDGHRVCLKQYDIWRNMLNRCYSVKLQQPTYKDCTVSENFKNYEYFYEWCNKQIGFNNDGWCLDKDLLIKGNKVYSEDTCVFLPQELNNLLTKRNRSRGNLPVGVCYNNVNHKFISQVCFNGVIDKYVGSFETPEEAFYAYKQAKEDFIKQQASKWKDQIDHRAYEALMNYQVDMAD